ncbi:MAG: CoA pyrophosphatase [Woeseiaceae bacterium]|nr:CoA pyrophosphatase [Woeseiaceae bacterium]
MHPDDLTAALLRERLADTRLPENPLDVTMPPGAERWPPDLREAVLSTLRPAGVLMPLIERDTGLNVLLTQRSGELKHHAGQIAFPGGGMEEADADIEATALRETHEEVGIEPADVSVIGYLDPMATISSYAVTPVIGLVRDSVELILDPTEVELAFEVPLGFLLDRRNVVAGERQWQGRTIPVVEMLYDGHRIWGATAYFLLRLRKKILDH